MNFYYEWTLYYLLVKNNNLKTCEPIYKLIQFNLKSILSIFLDMYTYKNIILYIVKSNLVFKSLFTNKILYFNLAYLIVKFKVRLKLDLFTK